MITCCTGQYSVYDNEDGARQKAVGSYLGELHKLAMVFTLFYILFLSAKVLDALTLNLEGKARAYESPVLSAVFLMNNYCFIQETYTR